MGRAKKTVTPLTRFRVWAMKITGTFDQLKLRKKEL